MKFSTSALLLTFAASASAAPKHHELENYNFETYVKDFDKVYDTGKEYVERAAIFAQNLKDIRKHNGNDASTYKKGVNQFTDMRASEGHFGYDKTKGSVEGAARARGLKEVDLPFKIDQAEDLPHSIDWREAGVVTAVKDQGGCGSCWAFSAAETLESHIAVETGTLYNLAPQQFVSCMANPKECGGSGGCKGATVDMAFDYLDQSGGIVQEYQMGYTSYYGDDGECYIHDKDMAVGEFEKDVLKGPDPGGVEGSVASIKGYAMLKTNDYLSLLNAVAKTGPVAISVAASPWKAYESGVFTMPGGFGGSPDNTDVNHAVQLVGYGTDEETNQDYWIVRNSWGPLFGEKGYIRILREDPAHIAPEKACGIDATPLHGTECKGFVGNVTVCGESGILYDNVIPVGGYLIPK